jgi:ABC-type multidrug transport system fused ATPase/permease subunit
MEKSIRDDLYEHLQRLDPAFHDEWQSGQLLSRATTDLGSIRRFAGFGMPPLRPCLGRGASHFRGLPPMRPREGRSRRPTGRAPRHALAHSGRTPLRRDPLLGSCRGRRPWRLCKAPHLPSQTYWLAALIRLLRASLGWPLRS